MKKIKLINILILIILILSTFCLPVFALEHSEYQDNPYIFKKEEYELAKESVLYEIGGEENIVWAYKLYTFNTRVAESVSTGKSINDITEDYAWAFATTNNTIEYTKLSDGNYKWFKGAIDIDPYDYSFSFKEIETAVTKLGTNMSDQNLTVKCIYAPNYKLNHLCYIKLKEQEYFMVFSAPDFTELENKRLYSLEEFLPYLEEKEDEFDKYAEYYEKTGERSMGGEIGKNSWINTLLNSKYLYLIIPVVLISFTTVLIIALKKKKV